MSTSTISQATSAARRTTHLWHPFTNMAHVAGHELVITSAQGLWLTDQEGRRYLDATASLWYSNIGHGRPEMARAIAEQIKRLDAYMTFGNFANPPALELSSRLAELAPLRDAKVFLTTGGGDSVETAAKLARRYWQLRGQSHRNHLIGRSSGFHGSFGFGTSLGGIEPNRAGFGPLVGDVSLVAHDSLFALEERINKLGPDRVAAVFCEPILGAGGVHHPPPGYLEGVSALCKEHNILLVADEVICAFGRLGEWFGMSRWPEVEPDMITFAKGVTSGYLPLGGVIVSGELAEPFWTSPGADFRQGATYAGHPTCCAAALANLRILEDEHLLDRARELEVALARTLAPLAEHELIAEVRAGIGLMAGLELDQVALRRRPGLVTEVASACRARGVLVRPLLSSLALSPPLIVTEDELSLIAATLGEALNEVARTE